MSLAHPVARFAADRAGTTAIEYALIAAIAAIGAIAGLRLFSASAAGLYSTIAGTISAAISGA
jgi:Flp pilus assembly pilin Flp